MDMIALMQDVEPMIGYSFNDRLGSTFTLKGILNTTVDGPIFYLLYSKRWGLVFIEVHINESPYNTLKREGYTWI